MSGTPDATQPERPGVVSAAVVVVIAAAALNTVIGVFVLSQLTAISHPTAAQPGGTAPGVFLIVIGIGVLAILYAAVLVALVLLFRAGRAWARAAFFSATLLSLFALLPPNVPAIAVAALLAAADVLLYRTSVTAWVRGLRGLRAA